MELRNNEKTSIIGGIIVILIVLGVLIARQRMIPVNQSTDQTPVAQEQRPPATNLATEQHSVTYTDSGFSPTTITVKKGDVIIFKNAASDSMRVASNPHPLHNGYPTTGGCVSSTFDSCQDIAPNSSWSFTFNLVGTWPYHNHLDPKEGGIVIVQ